MIDEYLLTLSAAGQRRARGDLRLTHPIAKGGVSNDTLWNTLRRAGLISVWRTPFGAVPRARS
jgi:hypothetical protein